MNPTPEQLAIVTRARDTAVPLLIEARAGAAKTTTLCLIAEALADKSILALAFNKKIAVEMTERLPAGTTSSTINALGNRAWKDFLGKWPKLNDKKAYEILNHYIERLDPEERDEAYDRFAETLQAVKKAKVDGYVPENAHPMMRSLVSEEDFFLSLDEEPSELQRELINVSVRTSIKLAFEGHIDFADQIYMPTLVKSASFPSFEVVLVDEAQDLSPLNHMMLKKIVKRARLIAVGDPCQAIYGFRGADEDSMSSLARMFDMQTMYLTICFRCAPEIVENAKWRAPDMQSWPSRPSGSVSRHDTWTLDLIPDGAAVICRNNAPLFYLALEFIRVGRSPEMLSGDIIPGLVKIMKKLKGDPLAALAQWEETEVARSRSPEAVRDKAEIIRLFIKEASSLAEAMRKLEALSHAAGRIKLMTGHKSKGLEFDEVFFLDSHLCRPKGQDRNVKYVIETRAHNHLHYITTDGLSL